MMSQATSHKRTHPKKTHRLRLLAKVFCGALLLATTLGGFGAAVKYMVLPGYVDPINRSYDSRYGYAQLLRTQGKPFPVTTSRVKTRNLTKISVGEGLMQSEPLQIPLIPLARITRVYVQEGDRVAAGDLLVELDTTYAQLKVEQAEAALATTQAELRRVQLGTDAQMVAERPERDALRLQAAKYEVEIRKELGDMYENLAADKLMARAKILENRLQAMRAYEQMQQSKLALETSKSGQEQSLEIARAAVRASEIAVAQARALLKDHRVIAPAEGVVERVLVHEGEYNQTAGKPALVLASGLWFEAHFDQSSLGNMQIGQLAEVRLEAIAGRTLNAKVKQIRRIISYNQGGPEANRPLRPSGTGAPEWPATYTVRLEVLDADVRQPAQPVVPGMTGFATSKFSIDSLAVPSGAIAAQSGSHAVVYCVNGQGYEARDVTLGYASDGWTAVSGGLQPGDQVIVDGHHVLEPGDLVAAEPHAPQPGQSTNQPTVPSEVAKHLNRMPREFVSHQSPLRGATP